MKLKNLYNSEVWATLCGLYGAVAVLRKDGSIELCGGQLSESLSIVLGDMPSSLEKKISSAFRGKGHELLLDIDNSSLPEFLKLQPVYGDAKKVEAVLVTVEAAPKDVLTLTEVQARLSEYDFIVQNIRQGIWRLDRKGKIVQCNPYLAQWLEYEPSDMVGKAASKFMVERLSDQSDDQPLANFETEFVTKSGIIRHALVASCPTYSSSGVPTGSIDIVTDITAEHALQSKLVGEVQKMAKLASLDPLTGAANRLAFDLALQSLSEEAETRPFGAVAIDLDFFKQINDTYGHMAGDAVLIEIVSKLKRFVRNTDTVARLGGDEFFVLLSNATAELTYQIATRIQERLQFTLSFDGNKIPVRVSLGWAHSSDGVKHVVRRADVALYSRRKFSRSSETIADMARLIDSQPEIL